MPVLPVPINSSWAPGGTFAFPRNTSWWVLQVGQGRNASTWSKLCSPWLLQQSLEFHTWKNACAMYFSLQPFVKAGVLGLISATGKYTWRNASPRTAEHQGHLSCVWSISTVQGDDCALLFWAPTSVHEEELLHWEGDWALGQRGSGASFPGAPKATWTQLWLKQSRGSCLSREVELDEFQWSLPMLTIPWLLCIRNCKGHSHLPGHSLGLGGDWATFSCF